MLRTVGEASSLVAPAPDGARLLLVDARMTTHAYDDRGKEQWSLGATRNFPQLAWSEDGTRVLAVTVTGGALLDAATGDVILSATGWAYGRSNQLPQAFPSGQPTERFRPISQPEPDVE